VISARNDKADLAGPPLLRKSVEAHWRPLDAPDRARAYSEQVPYVYRIDGGRSRDLNEYIVTPGPSTRLSAVITVDQSRADGRKQFYSLSPIGADLRPVIRSIDHWGREYSTEIAGIGR
jgi:hypothetical protein